jgi:hypothetical protein
MSQLITDAFVEQYRNNVFILSQQRGSKLRRSVMEEPLVGRSHFFERLGPTVASLKTARHAPTPLTDSQHSRRRVQPNDYQWADVIDVQDRLRMLLDPESEYAMSAAMAIGRAMDDEIITAFEGAAATGQSGAGTQAFLAANDIANGGTGLTTAKVRQAKRILDVNDVMEEDRWIVVSPIGLEDMLADANVINSDFNTVKALVQGELNTWLGFTWIVSTRLPLSGNIRTCYAWTRRAMGLAVNKDLQVMIDRRPDLQNATQVYVCGTFGSVRVEDEAVVAIDIDESV